MTENKAILNRFSIIDELDQSVIETLKSCSFLLALLVYFGGILSLILQYSLFSAIIIVIFIIPISIISYKSGQASYKATQDVQYIVRKYNAMEEVLESSAYTAERNLFHYRKKILKIWEKLFEQAHVYQKKVFSKLFFKAQMGGILFTFFAIISIYMLFNSLQEGNVSFGLFSSLVVAFIGLSETLSWNLSDTIDSLIKGLNVIGEYEELMKLKEEIRTSKMLNEIDDFLELEIRDISFSYPESKASVINNVSFKIVKGNTYALVGANGSGKSTLVKILVGLYHNFTGEIAYNSQIGFKKLLNLPISVVLQDYVHYYLTIRECITLGCKRKVADEEIENVLQQLNFGIDIQKLPHKLATNLGRIYDEGIDLSGGQWQKLSLARAIISDAPIIVLDEPTSALDPISEVEIMKKFESLCKDKTIFYITHRLGSIINVDHIMV